VTSTPGWTPAPRAGLVPLYPYGFGTALGRSFTALRGNPKVLLGFAVGVQAAASLIGLAVIGGVAALTFGRLDTVAPSSEHFEAIFAGSTAITVVVTILTSLALSAVSVIVQGVVVAEVSRAVVGERATLRQLWAVVRPTFWRLAGWFALQLLAGAVIALVVAVPMVAGAATEQWGLMMLAIPLLLALFPLWAWLGTKLYLVPSAIVLEAVGPITGIRRSWVLTRGRFWPTFGVMILINLLVGGASSVVGFPLQIASSFLPAIVMPFGASAADPGPAIGIAVAVAVVSAALQVLVSAIGTIVVATGGALMYVDARMRREGLDLRLQAYIEQRELGATALPDPWAYDPSHVAPPRATYHPGAYPPGQPYPPQQHPPTQGYPAAQHPPTQGYPAAQHPPAQGYPPAAYPPAQPQPQPPAAYPPVQGNPPAAPGPAWPAPPPPPGAGGS